MLPLSLGVAALLSLVAVACGDGAPSVPSRTDTQGATATSVPTPLEDIECGADVPDVTLESAGASQAALPLASEWVGLDCAIGGPGAAYYYMTPEPLKVSPADDPTLVFSREPTRLSVLLWSPDFTSSTTIGSSAIALPMDSVNVAKRFEPVELDVSPLVQQRLDIADIRPGDYALELLGEWPDGVATFSMHIVVAE